MLDVKLIFVDLFPPKFKKKSPLQNAIIHKCNVEELFRKKKKQNTLPWCILNIEQTIEKINHEFIFQRKTHDIFFLHNNT